MTDPYGQPAYGPPRPYPQSPLGPPTVGPPPPKRNRWLVPALVGGGLALALCCGGIAVVAASGDSPSPSDASRLVDQPAKAPAEAPAAAPEDPPEEEAADVPAGPPSAKVGETITITGGLLNGDTMAFTVRSVKVATSDNMFTQPGKNKKYVAVDISVLMKEGEALMTGSEITLQARDGEVYNNQTLVVHDDAFEWTNLSAGQRKSGLVFFEVPKALAIKGVKVLVQDFWDNKPAGVWAV